MTTSTVEDRAEQIAAAEPTATFQTDQVFTVAGGHFIHDTYSAFIAPLIPLLQERLGVGYAGAGSLAIYAQMPSLLNPFIGYLADRVSLRYFIILAPAVTATLMSCMGLTSNYLALAMLMLAAGVSMAAFHAPAPAMIGRLAGQRTGTGMSIFMASGELGRTVGPLFVTAG
ncbi:MAG: MFS transporter, partial [Caldilineaceae bacterium]|nr:MFS transporter [Caldilineaceae bacterium]